MPKGILGAGLIPRSSNPRSSNPRSIDPCSINLRSIDLRSINPRSIRTALVIAFTLLALLAELTLLGKPAFAQSGDGYNLRWNTIDNGGGKSTSTGDGFRLRGTIGQADAGILTAGGYVLRGGYWVPRTPIPPITASYPHDRRKNRYISFDPNKTDNDGNNVAFKVELKAITLGSCNGTAGNPPQVDFCRADRNECSLSGNPCTVDSDCNLEEGTCSVSSDCNTCVGAPAENACINQAIDCVTGTCTPTGETCVNDAPNAGGSNVGTVWWVGPENPVNPSVHLLVSQSFRKESTDWPNPVHVGDCEVVPEAVYGVRAVNVLSGGESGELSVETTLYAASSASWWGDCVGPLKTFCGGDIRGQSCDPTTGNGECTGPGTPAPCCTGVGTGLCDCTAPATCDRAWTLPDGSVNFDDVNAALALVAPGAASVAPDVTWVDLHGNGTGTPGSQNFDPPNGILNFSDIGQIISGFGGFPYKGYDPKDCPDAGTWP